jgi:hypothetical protein
MSLDAVSNTRPATANETPIEADARFHREITVRLIDGERTSDRRLIRLGEWCSPILVKEVRQALKSRQFNWTLVLLMICIAIWTGFVVLSLIPAIYYFPSGKTLLSGYFFVLLIPALLVVPNAAYRSMASELDQGTFDVLSLSPLSPFKIVLGKLAVAMLQSLIYFSALAPCMALSYLLRGVPLPSIIYLLIWAGVCSFLLSSLGILLGTWNRYGNFGTLLSILMIIASGSLIFTLEISFATVVGFYGFWDSKEMFLFGAMFWSVLLAYGGLFLLCAAAAIGVAGENYSSRIRAWLLGMTFLFIGSLVVGVGFSFDGNLNPSNYVDDYFAVLFTYLAIHWGISGVFLIGERGVAGPRSQRSLPSSLLGRLFLSWFNPGSGTGYLFALLSFAGCALGLLVGATQRFVSSSQSFALIQLAVLLSAYLVLYLGLTRLALVLTSIFPALIGSRMIMAPCFALLFVLCGTFFPLLTSGLMNGTGEPSYEWYTILNPFWTVAESETLVIDPSAWLLFASLSLIVFALNFAWLSRDVTMVRVEAPPAVQNKIAPSSEIPHPLDG